MLTHLELDLAAILALGKDDIEALAVHHTLVHLVDSASTIVGVAKADKAEALATKLAGLLLGLSILILS
jgi:hypothetical protein